MKNPLFPKCGEIRIISILMLVLALFVLNLLSPMVFADNAKKSDQRLEVNTKSTIGDQVWDPILDEWDVDLSDDWMQLNWRAFSKANDPTQLVYAYMKVSEDKNVSDFYFFTLCNHKQRVFKMDMEYANLEGELLGQKDNVSKKSPKYIGWSVEDVPLKKVRQDQRLYIPTDAPGKGWSIDTELNITNIPDDLDWSIEGANGTAVYNQDTQYLSDAKKSDPSNLFKINWPNNSGDYWFESNGSRISDADALENYNPSGTYVGSYEQDIRVKDDVEIWNKRDDGTKVKVTKYMNPPSINNGELEITPITEETVVSVTGATKTVTYDGNEQDVKGWTYHHPDSTIAVSMDNEDLAMAKGTDVGTHPMDLESQYFTATSDNYTNLVVVVTDGWLKINLKGFEVNYDVQSNKEFTKIYGDLDPTNVEEVLQEAVNEEIVKQGLNKGDIDVNVYERVRGEDVAGSPYPYEVGWEQIGDFEIDQNESVQITAELSILKRALRLQPVGAMKDYDGKPLTASEYRIVDGSLAAGDNIDKSNIKYLGSITDIGVAESRIDASSVTLLNDRTMDNYDLTLLPGLLTINEVQGEIVNPGGGESNNEPQDDDDEVLGEIADNKVPKSQGEVLGEEAKTLDSMNTTIIVIMVLSGFLTLMALMIRLYLRNLHN
jgi:hypothetical protein